MHLPSFYPPFFLILFVPPTRLDNVDDILNIENDFKTYADLRTLCTLIPYERSWSSDILGLAAN